MSGVALPGGANAASRTATFVIPSPEANGYAVLSRSLQLLTVNGSLLREETLTPTGEEKSLVQYRVTDLEPDTTYGLRLRSQNALGWQIVWSGVGQCTTAKAPLLIDQSNSQSAASPGSPVWLTAVFIGGSLVICAFLCCVTYLFCKKRNFNASLMPGTGSKNRKKKSIDLTKYMDHTFTPGLDDSVDIEVNPVLVQKMETARKEKRRAIKPGGVGRSGGLARLGLSGIDKAPKQQPGGKSNTARGVERYLDSLGVDVSEGAMAGAIKEAGYKGMTAAQAAKRGVKTGPDQSKARNDARQAIQKAKAMREMEGEGEEQGTNNRSRSSLASPGTGIRPSSSQSMQMDL